MCEVIAVVNKKGGTGKTTTAINLAGGLFNEGKAVCVIDADPQGHMTKFADVDDNGMTILDVLEGMNINEVLQPYAHGFVLPINSSIEQAMSDNAITIAPTAVRRIIKSIKNRFDYILIDFPPSVNQLTYSALVAADKVVIPTEASFFAVDGVTMLVANTIRKVQENENPGLRVAGLLLVKYKANQTETQLMERSLELIAREYFNTKIFKAKIREAVAVTTSQRLKRSIFDYAPRSTVSQDYYNFIAELIA